jgi:tRNA (Thr-GGU) A37 N-methylase
MKSRKKEREIDLKLMKNYDEDVQGLLNFTRILILAFSENQFSWL